MSAIENEFKCANCETVSREDVFCPHCGQKRLRPGDLSLANAWRHVVDEVFNLDGRVIHTLKLLFTKPGLLTLDFLDGRRARHVHPVRLFLVFSALYFVIEGAAMSSGIARVSGVVTDAMSRIEREQIEAAGQVAFKMAFIGSVLVNGLLLWLFFHKRRPLIAENMVTALHLSCVAMTITIVVGTAARLLHVENIAGGITGALLAPFGIHSFNRVYREPRQWLSGVCLVVILVTDILIVSFATVTAVHYQAGTFN